MVGRFHFGLLLLIPSAAYESRDRWVPNNASGCLDDPYYYDAFFVSMGQGTCRLDAADTTGNGRGTTTTYDVTSRAACLDLCFSLGWCTGVEFREARLKCEIWNQTVGYFRTSSSANECIAKQERACADWVGTASCAASIEDLNATTRVDRLLRSCPQACADVTPTCPSDFRQLDANVGGLYLTSGGTVYQSQLEQYHSGYNMFFQMRGQVNAHSGALELTSLSADGGEEALITRARYLVNRLGAKVLLGPYGDESFEAVATVAEESKVVLMGPISKSNETVASHDTVFSMTRTYAETFLASFQEIAQKGQATVSFIGPSWARASASGREAAYRTCEAVPETAQMAQLVFLHNVTLDFEPGAANAAPLAAAMQQLVTPRPEVIVCCETAWLCATEILSSAYQLNYDAKAFIMLEDDSISLALNYAAINDRDKVATNTFVRDELASAGDVQSQAMTDQWMWSTYLALWRAQETWKPEILELMKGSLVVSDWDRSVKQAPGYMYLQHYFARTHSFPESAAAWSGASVLLEAMHAANSTDGQAVAAALMSMDVDTVMGRVTFDEMGRRSELAATMQLDIAPPEQGPGGHAVPMHSSLAEAKLTLRHLTPRQTQNRPRHPLTYPKMAWSTSFCYHEFLAPFDGQQYGLVMDNDTGVEMCLVCPTGASSVWDQGRRERNCRVCPAGSFVTYGLCKPCPAGSYSDEEGSPDCSSCEAGSFQSLEGQTACEPCPAGTFTAQGGSSGCTGCSEVFDISDTSVLARWAPEGSTACLQCPLGGVCAPDGQGMYSNFSNGEGYFYFPELFSASGTSGLFRCSHGAGLACKEQSCFQEPGTGEVAMHGPMCGACMPGFAKPIGQPLKLCERCPSMLWCILGVCVQLLVILGMSSFLMVVNALSDYSKPKNIFSIILKQFLNYLQMAGAVLSTGGAHGLYGGLSIVSGFDVVQDYLGFGSAGWMPVAGSCLIEQLLPGFGVHKVVTLVGLAWFPATAITSTLGFVLVRLVRRLMGWGGLDLRHLQTWLMVNFFLYLPRVNRLLIVNFGCQTFDTSRLTMDPRVSCWSQEHVVWQMLSWGGLFVFSVGGPLLLYMVLRRLYKSEVLGSYRVLKTYGFLFAGFEPSFYYFECIYMFRKLCFELVMTLPGMTSEDQAILGRINNSSVAFVASVFFGLHMACQPYDNRDYFILDRIETASSRAILITAFLQLWCLDTNDADGILHVPVLREVRNLFCTAAIVLLHLYFLWLVFYALARRRLQGWVATCTGRDFSQGSVVFVPDGLLLKNLNAREENLLETMFAQMVEVHAGSKRKIAFDSWAGGLQMLCLESQRSKVEAEIKSLDSVGLTLRSWRERAAKLFNHNRLGNLCERFIDRLEDAYGLLGHQNGNSLLQTRQKDLEDLKLFCAESLNKLLNHEFRVEELQDSMLCLGREIADYKRISGLGASDGEREGSESDEKPDLAFYVGEMELGDSAAVLVERSNAEEVKHLREEVQDRLMECHELRRQLATIRRDLTVNRNRSRTSLIAQGSIMSQMEDYEREEEDLETKLQEQEKEAQRLREELEAKLAAAEGTAAELEQKLEESKEEAAEAREAAETKAEAKDFEIHSLQAELRKLLAASQVCWSCTTKLPAAAKFCFKCGQATTEVL